MSTLAASTPSTADRLATLLRWTFFLVLGGVLAWYVAFSWHWPILRDTSIMHYVNFLMAHGMQPYRDITDNNLPGAYLAERLGMLVFGPGDLAWRLADWSLLATITVAMVVIARPYDWLAGLFGGGMFALLHGSEGPDFPMEREQILTALLVVGFALLFTAVRHRRPFVMLPFGLCAGMAANIKPTTAPFGAFLLLAAAWLAHRRRDRPLPYLLWGAAGIALVGAVILAFLLHFHAMEPLLFIARRVMPSYVSMGNRTLPQLLRMMMPLNLLLPTALGLLLALLQRNWNAERWLVFLGVLFGAFSFIAQRKGSIYHRYPFAAFLLLLLGLEFFPALRARVRLPRSLAAAGLLATLFLSIPHYVAQLRSSPERSTLPFATTLTADLRSLEAGGSLQRQVECLDLTYGCFSALYHLGLVENNGFTGDLLLFSPVPSPAVTFYRDRFWQLTLAHPPAVFVLSNEWFPYDLSFRKLATWPLFASYLADNYQEVLARSFPHGSPAPGSADPDAQVPGYRIFIRKGTPWLRRPPTQPAP